MNNQQTIDLLTSLKLKGMAKEYEALLRMPRQMRPGMEMTVAKLADAERNDRHDRKTQLYLKASKLRYMATIEDIICSAERNLSKDQMSEVADCSFVSRAENLLITGLTGCGKSYLACALGRQACMLGYRTEYMNMNKFIERIAMAKADGTFLKLVTHLDKNDLIILDDFGLQPLDTNSRLALLQILEERYERKSVIIASQLPVNKWYDYIAEPTLADAIMDRLVNNATHFELSGPSLRKIRKK